MLRQLVLLSVTVLLCLPTKSQAPTLPFAYVIESNAVDQNAFVMDALSGEILYAFDTDEGICPTSVSDDGEWFVYSHDLTNNFIMNLETSEIQRLEEGIVNQVAWSSEYNMAAFHYNQFGVNHVFVFGTTREEFFFDFSLPESWSSNTVSRFAGLDIVSAALEVDTKQITIYRANRNDSDRQVFDFNARQDWGRLSLSPNGQFLMAFGNDGEIYTMNLETGASYELGTAAFASIDWLPSEAATLAYIAENDEGIIQLETLAPDVDASIIAEIPFTLSPDGTYVYYKIIDSENADRTTLWLLNTATKQQTDIAIATPYVSQIQWLSESQFVYRNANPDAEDTNMPDLFFYDAETHENRQLTDTPDLGERFDCFRG